MTIKPPLLAADLCQILRPGCTVREAAPGILSVLPSDAASHAYDAKAAIYDLVVARRFYNRVLWGTNLDDYAAFAQLAIAAPRSGWLLDAGCGSLVFTKRVYAHYAGPPIVLVDQSIGMLQRARRRLVQAAGDVSPDLLFLQADLLDMPFRAAAFETISCPGLLHLFADPAPLVEGLCQSLMPAGNLYLTSLVQRPERRLATRYLHWLERNGEIAGPRTLEEVCQLLKDCQSLRPGWRTARGNMAYFASRPFWDAQPTN